MERFIPITEGYTEAERFAAHTHRHTTTDMKIGKVKA